MLVAGTTVLAFHSGGYFEGPRAVATACAWGVAALLAVTLPRDQLLPSRRGLIALAGLIGLTAWTAIAGEWAPLAGPAEDDVERLLLYLGLFVAALLALCDPRARRLLEPAMAASALITVGYGLAGRLLPGIFELERSASANGRLEQPLTYWNAMGALAAIGLVLGARLAADPRRPRWLRTAALAAAPVLGLGIYLSFSRGALLAIALGLTVLVVLAPSRAQVSAAIAAVLGSLAAALLAAQLPAVESLDRVDDAERQGLLMLALLALTCAATTIGALRAMRAGEASPDATAPSRRGSWVAIAVVGAVVLIPLVGAPLGLKSGDTVASGADASRFGSVGSNRYAYWRVALDTFAEHPLDGVGPGGFRVEWMRERDIVESVRDAHSLQLETAAELGLPGLAFLVLLFGGVIAAARVAWPGLLGACAALVSWATAAAVDWNWEMPALGALGLLLSAALIAEARERAVSPASG